MKVYKKDFKNADLMCLEMFKDSVLTEKSINYEMYHNCMTFLVHKNITKHHVKFAIEEMFKTEVINVRVINTKSKRKSNQKRKNIFTPTYKKVMVRVADLDAVRGGLNG